jgi:hypothetical protein
LIRRDDDPGAFTKTDAHKSLALAPASEVHLVAIFEEATFLTAGQPHRIRPA